MPCVLVRCRSETPEPFLCPGMSFSPPALLGTPKLGTQEFPAGLSDAFSEKHRRVKWSLSPAAAAAGGEVHVGGQRPNRAVV